ncbi:hypothetical protein IE81DRAFT_323954 [Ceraceosorus guamensis]|uniref:Uncharacterized protein n=1 Tax=Ceraceosorus guamensis TaxID=1522189 RepID=A0A316VZT3_9BASI|nr:hypothetical protein IE81DRAFT_323954 [Ceraceosorus guamensis]PWN41953.1 hypothetical protein IE81DRAFT_323954 [Ceraceosorus guamensis]
MFPARALLDDSPKRGRASRATREPPSSAGPAPATPPGADKLKIGSGTSKSIWQSYLALTPKSRLIFGAGLAAVAVAGLLVSDELEERFPATETEKDGPGLFRVTMVDAQNRR